MGLKRKGSRKIIVRGVAYRYVVGRPKLLSPYAEPAPGLLDERYLERARPLGLGHVAPATIALAIELYEAPRGRLGVQCRTHVVDGFLGPEQLAPVRPRLVRALVERALDAGWNPSSRDVRDLGIVEESANPTPIVLDLPAWPPLEGYPARRGVTVLNLSRSEDRPSGERAPRAPEAPAPRPKRPA